MIWRYFFRQFFFKKIHFDSEKCEKIHNLANAWFMFLYNESHEMLESKCSDHCDISDTLLYCSGLPEVISPTTIVWT